MRSGRRLVPAVLWVVLAFLFVASVQGPAAAITPAESCAIAKQKAAVKAFRDKLDCYHRALKKGAPVDETCLTRADARLAGSFAKAEAGGGCQTTGDAAAIEALVDMWLAELLAALPVAPITTTTTTSTTTTPTTTTSSSTTSTTAPCISLLQSCILGGVECCGSSVCSNTEAGPTGFQCVPLPN